MNEITDHTPSEYPQDRDATLLLSFDEFAELEGRGNDWIRKATFEEIGKLAVESGREDTIHKLSMDDTGRPYMFVTVLRTAPGHIWRRATSNLRLFRFKEK